MLAGGATLMDRYRYSGKKPGNPLGYVLLLGLALGIGISIILFFSLPDGADQAALPTTTRYSTIQSKPTNATNLVATQTPFAVILITPQTSIQSRPLVGNPAPDFALKTLAGDTVRLGDLKGKPILINFWASWCIPCRIEMPAIQTAYKKYKDKGLVVLGVNDTYLDNLADVNTFVSEFKLTFPILLNETSEIPEDLYGVIGLPTSFFIDSEGTIQFIQIGAMSSLQLEENLKKIFQ
jgi:peroxiredoxin